MKNWYELITKGIKYDPQRQLSTQMADRIERNPLIIPKEWDKTQREIAISTYVGYYNIISNLGWYEHTSDWDPAIKVTLYNGEEIGDEPGYAESELTPDFGLMVDLPEIKGKTIKRVIPVDDIAKIEYFFN